MRFKIVEDAQFKNDTEILEFLYGLQNITLYETESGNCPVEDFIFDIPNKKLQEKIILDIAKLNARTYTAKMPLVEYLRDGIYELRSSHKNNWSRIFYFFVAGSKIVLTHGYLKKQNATNNHEIDKAVACRKDYIRRGE